MSHRLQQCRTGTTGLRNGAAMVGICHRDKEGKRGIVVQGVEVKVKSARERSCTDCSSIAYAYHKF